MRDDLRNQLESPDMESDDIRSLAREILDECDALAKVAEKLRSERDALAAEVEPLKAEQDDITIRAICADSMADEQRERAKKAEAERNALAADVSRLRRQRDSARGTVDRMADALGLGDSQNLSADCQALAAEVERLKAEPEIDKAAVRIDTVLYPDRESGKKTLVFAVPRPLRHDSAIMATVGALRIERMIGLHEQGFTTTTGRFVDREEAGRIAFAAGQTPRLLKGLMSEDIW